MDPEKMTDSPKPVIVFGCTPVTGHIIPVRAIVKNLVARGYDVCFVAASYYQKPFEEIGCDFIAVEGVGDWHLGDVESKFPEMLKYAPGAERVIWTMEHIMTKAIPSQHVALQKAFKKVSETHPGRPIVLVNEQLFHGGIPILCGAPGIKPTANISIGVIPILLTSIDTAPFGAGLPPDSSPEGRARNIAAAKHAAETAFASDLRAWDEVMREMGATPRPIMKTFDASYVHADRFIQTTIPSAEYPRSDAPPSIRFGGGVPQGSTGSDQDPPSWWPEVAVNEAKKDVVFVCQGTLAIDNVDLIVSTVKALADRPNTLTIAALGQKGATLPSDVVVPANARVVDYIPFDELLPFCAVFTTNAGYGAFQHAIGNGTPLVCAGMSEDKMEVAARVEWCGMGLNLRTSTPTEAQLRKAVDEVIADPKYRTRAKEMQAESTKYDIIQTIEDNINELVAAAAGQQSSERDG